MSVKMLHDWVASQVAKLSVSTFRPGRRSANLAYHQAMEIRRQFQTWDQATQEDYILVGLRNQVNYARRNVPYYRDLLESFPKDFPGTFADFRKIPPLEKEVIRPATPDLISGEFERNQLEKMSTGGSTGEPVSVYLTKQDNGFRDARMHHYLQQIGGEPGKRVGTLYGGKLDVSVQPGFHDRAKEWLTNSSLHGCFRLDDDYLLSVHRDFDRFQPNVIVAYASAIFLLASILKKNHIKPNYPRACILTGAEKLENWQRRQIEEVFSVPVVERYGSRELGLIAYQLPGDRRFWIERSSMRVEPDGIPDENGYAPLLITSFHMRGMPLIRYRIGDIGKFSADWNESHPSRCLEEIAGRVLDFIYLPGGKKIHSVEFPHLFKDFDIQAYQVIQNVSGDTEIKIVKGPEFSEDSRSTIERILKQNLAGVPVEISFVTEINRTQQAKLRPVISHFRPDSSKTD